MSTGDIANIQGGSVLNANVPGDGSGVVELEFTVQFGAAGAPTLVTNRPDIVGSVARTGAGRFTITYTKAMPSGKRSLDCSPRIGDPATPFYAFARLVAGNSVTQDLFATCDLAGAAADPASGDLIHFRVRTLRDGGNF